jgi:pilus assembly protein CpaF
MVTQLLISNTLSGERWVEALTKSEVWIGRKARDEQDGNLPDVAVASRLFSRRHVLLRQVDGGWSLEHHGRNETLVGEQPVEPGRPRPVGVGDEIRIGEYVFALIETQEDLLPETAVDGLARLLELERGVHTQLLERMDLRRGDRLVDVTSPETRARIESELDRIVDAQGFRLAEEDLKPLMAMALHRRLSYRIMRAGSQAPDARSQAVIDSPVRGMITAVENRMCDDLGLTLEPRSMAEDSAKLELGFRRVCEARWLDFTEGMRLQLVKDLVRQDILDLIFGLGPLQDLVEADSISEIMVVSRGQIFVEKFGVVEDTRRAFFSDDAVMAVVERIVAPIGRRVDRSTPLVDARLPDGSRVNIIIPPLAVKGPCLTIRKFAKIPLKIDDMLRFGAVSPAMVKFLRACVEAHKNIVVSGGTGSGKTTLLNCLSSFIPRKERIVTIEDTVELQLQQPHVVTLETRPPNMEGRGEVTMRDLVKNALRMRPDRIVVGECRGAEALDMLQAMNTGHDGSMTTGHANSPADMMLRLETMVLMGTDMPVAAIREQIASAIDVVVQLTRFPDGSRRVSYVSEVVGIDDERGTVLVEDVFVYRLPGDGQYDNGCHIHTGYIPTFVEELLEKGVMTLDTFF